MTNITMSAPLRWRTALLFLAIGLVIYGVTLAASEALVYRNGHANPLYKVATATQRDYDWVILGASHAMPLDFGDTQEHLEAATGLKIINLAAQGAGPLYNRFVLEQFFEGHGARTILYVVDSFAFRSRLWNEDRLADAKLLRRTPLDPAIAMRLASYVASESVEWRALLDYLSGFSKLNNRDRLAVDRWEGEAQFTRRYRRSEKAEDDRIAYLYPDGSANSAVLDRYFDEFEQLLMLAGRHHARIVVIKMPVPSRFHDKLPGEAEFDAALLARLNKQHVPFYDWSRTLDDPSFYFDSDHLGEAGVDAFIERSLIPLLRANAAGLAYADQLLGCPTGCT